MVYIPKKVIPVLMHMGELGMTAPIIRVYDTGHSYDSADVRFNHLAYPRLADAIRDGEMNHGETLVASYNMGHIIGFLSKYHVQDGDQNLGNWLVKPDRSVVKIDFDVQHTRFIEYAPDDLDFWLYANAYRFPDDSDTMKKVLDLGRRHAVKNSLGPMHFVAVSNYAGGPLPADYDADEYIKRYLEGFNEEFAAPLKVSYEELCGTFPVKTEEMRKRD